MPVDRPAMSEATSMADFKTAVAEGLPDVLPERPPFDESVDHAPPRRAVLSADEKRLALRNALR